MYIFIIRKKCCRVNYPGDHPASQATKLGLLKQIFGELPIHVTFVAIDFTREDLAEGLFTHGYAPALMTLFIWQEVT